MLTPTSRSPTISPDKVCLHILEEYGPPDRPYTQPTIDEDWLTLYNEPMAQHTTFRGPSSFYPHQSKGTHIPMFYQAVYHDLITL